LDGYVNIDYPLDQHGVLTHGVADVFADISGLAFPGSSVDEIRLHHVLEHFPRAQSLGLVASWWSWLKPGGLLRVEVPDFDRTAWAVLSPFNSQKKRAVALRHIFGSQDAPWAYHKEGWSGSRLSRVIRDLGYDVLELRRNAWKGTYNVEILALKRRFSRSRAEFEAIAEEWLGRDMVSDTEFERRSLQVWKRAYCQQVERSWGIDE
jgi:SAM-dependent methyltransferase